MRISDWSSDVCSSDLRAEIRGAERRRPRRLGQADEEARSQGRPHRRTRHPAHQEPEAARRVLEHLVRRRLYRRGPAAGRTRLGHPRELDAEEREEAQERSEEHTSELQSLMRISYAVFCLKKK